MSNTESPSPQDSPARLGGCMTAILVILGVIMLLPGLCALLFGGGAIFYGKIDSGLVPYVTLGLLVGLGGVAVIWVAIAGRRRR